MDKKTKKIYKKLYKKILTTIKENINETFDDSDDQKESKIKMNQEMGEFLKKRKNQKGLISKLTEGYINQLNSVKGVEKTYENAEVLVTPQGVMAAARIIYGAVKAENIMAQINALKAKQKKIIKNAKKDK